MRLCVLNPYHNCSLKCEITGQLAPKEILHHDYTKCQNNASDKEHHREHHDVYDFGEFIYLGTFDINSNFVL